MQLLRHSWLPQKQKRSRKGVPPAACSLHASIAAAAPAHGCFVPSGIGTAQYWLPWPVFDSNTSNGHQGHSWGLCTVGKRQSRQRRSWQKLSGSWLACRCVDALSPFIQQHVGFSECAPRVFCALLCKAPANPARSMAKGSCQPHRKRRGRWQRWRSATGTPSMTSACSWAHICRSVMLPSPRCALLPGVVQA